MSNKLSITRKKRKSMSLDMKMKILNRLEKGEKPTAIAKAYGINESTVRTIRKRKEIIRSSVASGTLSSLQCSSYTRNPEIENMEKTLMIWIDDNIQKKIPMNSLIIREKAVHIFNKLKEQASSIDKMSTFSASKGWFQNFQKRYSLPSLKFKGEAASYDKSSAEEFSLKFTKIVEESGYVPDQIFNTDEGALFWKKICNRTFVTNTELINISETQSHDVCSNDNEETDSFTAKNLSKALEFARKLEYAIREIDPNIERVLKFRQNLMKCCSEYQQIYENLVTENIEKNSSEKIYIRNENEDELSNISSD